MATFEFVQAALMQAESLCRFQNFKFLCAYDCWIDSLTYMMNRIERSWCCNIDVNALKLAFLIQIYLKLLARYNFAETAQNTSVISLSRIQIIFYYFFNESFTPRTGSEEVPQQLDLLHSRWNDFVWWTIYWNTILSLCSQKLLWFEQNKSLYFYSKTFGDVRR